MCIKHRVGKGCTNEHRDVLTVQILLNLNLRGLPEHDGPNNAPVLPIKEDGKPGKETWDRIIMFQSMLEANPSPSGRVDPTGDTIHWLGELLSSAWSVDMLRGIMIHHAAFQRATAVNAAKYLAHLQTYMPQYDIYTPLRQAHFLGQVALETNLLLWSQETASGAAYEGNAGLGNTEAGDGVRFKGRGLLQLTGRTNYKRYGEDANIDLLTKPNEQLPATDAAHVVRSACFFWRDNKLNAPADNDNGMMVSQIINGSSCSTLAERAYYTKRAKFFLKV
jgi:putative chitinase